MTTTATLSELTDVTLRDEIELVADLVVAAAGCVGRMSQSEVDEILGVRAPRREG